MPDFAEVKVSLAWVLTKLTKHSQKDTEILTDGKFSGFRKKRTPQSGNRFDDASHHLINQGCHEIGGVVVADHGGDLACPSCHEIGAALFESGSTQRRCEAALLRICRDVSTSAGNFIHVAIS